MLFRLLAILLSLMLSMQSLNGFAEEIPGEKNERIEVLHETSSSRVGKKQYDQLPQPILRRYPSEISSPSFLSKFQPKKPTRLHLLLRVLLI